MWRWTVTDEKMVVYDHTGTEVARVDNDGSGFSRMNVKDVMHDEVLNEYRDNGFNKRVFAILRDAIFEQIEQIE